MNTHEKIHINIIYIKYCPHQSIGLGTLVIACWRCSPTTYFSRPTRPIKVQTKQVGSGWQHRPAASGGPVTTYFEAAHGLTHPAGSSVPKSEAHLQGQGCQLLQRIWIRLFVRVTSLLITVIPFFLIYLF